MKRYALDASALLAYLGQEPGADKVAEVVENGKVFMSSINLAEVLGKVIERGMSEADARAMAQALPFDIVDFDAEQAHGVAYLRKYTKALGLSLGDRACLTLAQTRQATALTADRIWAQCPIPNIQIELLRS